MGGKIGGKSAVESGQLASITTKESCSKGGKIGGKMAVESGQISALGKKQGKLKRKLSYEDAQMIRELYSTQKYKQRELAKMYDMFSSAISLIINNKSYTQP